jgi:hypothetical protein
VHVSQLSHKFVTDAREVVKTGDIVKVKVLEVDVARKRIGLSMKLERSNRHGGALIICQAARHAQVAWASEMKALRIYAGPKARLHIEQHGLRPQDVGVVPGAAGGPKGLILGPLDRFIFGEWLPQSSQPVHLVGALHRRLAHGHRLPERCRARL